VEFVQYSHAGERRVGLALPGASAEMVVLDAQANGTMAPATFQSLERVALNERNATMPCPGPSGFKLVLAHARSREPSDPHIEGGRMCPGASAPI
jgi:hypothetical protein